MKQRKPAGLTNEQLKRRHDALSAAIESRKRRGNDTTEAERELTEVRDELARRARLCKPDLD